MGASDWAGRMCDQLEGKFDICDDRALRVTTLVRLLRGEGRENVFGEHGGERWARHKELLIDRLDESLEDQPGETIEARWNNLMDDLDCQDRAEKGVYLIPWDEHDAEDWQDPGVTDSRPE
ncbi:hypothetical protein Huta_1924 [Halorhabdus utahensis DSM 12940]|uniref:Uncharacterized protein n=1 Tax=Halorhabdus utahensis (strain DSM 12940 / JCM 11049 / AX-2) TaxID=519442 RepID=C7NT18_HALUD|nr:hypothetical protein [Halorhabdus utahensis]ACV12093.1 hypothetical protein Huta_1924 [Halorhabdus utahensis DSM 12940]